MQNEQHFVLLIDVRPGAIVFGSKVVVDDREQCQPHDAAHLNELVTRRLIGGIESALLQVIKGDPKQAASILKMEIGNVPSDRPRGVRGGRQFDTTYSLKLAIMHPDKLRELEKAVRDLDEHRRVGQQLAKTVDSLRGELATAEQKAVKYDRLMADIAAVTTQPVLDNCANPADC